MFSNFDHECMALALRLAANGAKTVHPNPMVGCVLSKDHKIIGRGWHERAGGDHAEVAAIKNAGGETRGATAYVTLEPCSRYGRTPPCTDALIEAGVTRVVYAMDDPSLSGAAVAVLREKGIAVETGLMSTQAQRLNPGFISRFTRQRPWVVSKVSASLDGKTALSNGVSQWITGEEARQHVHELRAVAGGVMTGSGTVHADNPSLTVRHVDTSRQPTRVVLDTQLGISPDAEVVQDDHETLVFYATGSDSRIAQLSDAGIKLYQVELRDGHLDLLQVMQILASHPINDIFVEAGARLNGALLNHGLIDELVLMFAPSLLGGSGRNMFALPEFESLNQRVNLNVTEQRMIGSDLCLRAHPLYSEE